MALTVGQPMGMGTLANSSIVFKRKFRWTFEVINVCSGNVPETFVKLAARPNISIEEQEINFLNGKLWIPGKGTWETIAVTYYDVAAGQSGASDMSVVYSWIASVYNFTDPIRLQQSSTAAGYSGIGVLNLYDGCGTGIEQWQLGNMWPQAINFGELDYSSSEECTVEVTLRYSQVKFVPLNGCMKPLTACCSGCSSPQTGIALGGQPAVAGSTAQSLGLSS